MPRLFKLTHNKTHVIELYCYSDEYPDQVLHEIISGTEAGSILTSLYRQDVRFIYVPDQEKFQRVIQDAQDRGYQQTIINLYEPENTPLLLAQVKEGDSLLIIGQGDLDQGLIAGRDASDLADIIRNDLELKKIPLQNLDIHSCMMGRMADYRNELLGRIKNFQTITTYTELCSVSSNQMCRIWISEDAIDFYKENELNEKGIRITEYTHAYKRSLIEAWRANPDNPEEIDLSEHIEVLAPPF